MVTRRIAKLPGMRDVAAQAYDRGRRTAENLQGLFNQRGYEVLDTPLLERTELFVRKSGGDLTSRLYTFADPGGEEVSLRPEFTSSVIRHFIERRDSLEVPVRWQYSGPVFRYEQGENGGWRQFTQLGAELVGASGQEADIELISLAWAGLESLGLRGSRLRVGHLGLFHGLLSSYRLSPQAKLFIISNIQGLKSRQTDLAGLIKRAEDAGLVRSGRREGILPVPQDVSREAAEAFVQSILMELMPAKSGRRTTEQIAARLLRKARDADDPQEFKDALALVAELASLDGPPEVTLQKARHIAAARGLAADVFAQLEHLLQGLTKHGIARSDLLLDLGFARGISYYTGVLFELTYPSPEHGKSGGGRETSFGGGGRYDGLVKDLGGDSDIPALGFAYNLDQVVDALDGTM